MQLKEAVPLFLDQYKASTRKSYASVLKPLMQRCGEALPVAEINRLDMIRYTNHIRQESGYSPATIRKHIKSLKTFFYWCVRLELIPKTPMQEIKSVAVDTYIGVNKAMTDDQLSRLYTYMDKNQIRYTRHRALVATLDDSGARIGEMAALRWPDVDLKSGTLYIVGKGDKRRPAFFFEVAAFALRDWYNAQQRIDGDHVFSHRGGPITSDTLQLLFRKLCIAAGIGSHGPHKLRHRKAHQLVHKGISPSVAATVIGDSVEVFMEHYAPRDYDSARAAARQVAQRPAAEQKIITATTHKSKSSG
jgi:site-specific recombinase XerD